eukprot:XP_020397349.1 uncharacterized protein LOC109941222 [Zea mays]
MSLCSPDIKAYFQLDIDKTKEKKSPRFRQQLRADEAARTHFGDDEYEDELKAALHQSRVEHEFSERAGARYDRGGGSSSQRVSRGALDRMMGRSREQVPERVRDYNLAQASGLRQQRIDTGPWTSVGVKLPTGREIDGKYLDENVKEFQKEIDKWKIEWNEFGATLMCDSWTGPTQKSIINFLVYCNGMMYFLKTVDATREVQDHKFIMQEIKNVLKIIDPENVVQIVTDNGSNFKKACKMLSRETIEYKHIVWQPCLAHTINLMLKDIGKWAHHEAMIQSAQRICSWMYNSSSLHSMMKKAIRGELVKWNATRFGTNCMFLESFMRRKDKFMVWFMSPEFRHSRYFLTEMGRYAFDNITNVEWWENMQYVLDEVEPLYVFLRFADQEKSPTLGEVLMQYTNTKHTYQSKFENDSARYRIVGDHN